VLRNRRKGQQKILEISLDVKVLRYDGGCTAGVCLMTSDSDHPCMHVFVTGRRNVLSGIVQ